MFILIKHSMPKLSWREIAPAFNCAFIKCSRQLINSKSSDRIVETNRISVSNVWKYIRLIHSYKSVTVGTNHAFRSMVCNY